MVDILHPILHNHLIHKEGMQEVDHIVAAIVETQAAVNIAQKETDHRKPVTPALPVMVLAVSLEMTVQSQVMATVAT